MFAYDGASRLTRATSVAGSVSYEYNALNRIVAVDDGTTRSTFTYDSLGNLDEAVGPNTDLDFDWDPAGRLVQVQDRQLSKTVGYTYDRLGRQTAMQADGQTTTYAHDLAGRLVGLTDATGDYGFGYDPGGRLTELTYPNGAMSQYGYDAADQLISLVSRRAGGAVLASSSYTYDAAGRRKTDTRAGGTTLSYDYDDAGRLVKEQSAGGAAPYLRRYGYDPVGNRTSLESDGQLTTYGYDDASELVDQHTGAATTTYDYDSAGNLATRTDASGETTYGYDLLGRLTGVTAPGSAVTYRNDAFGNRVGRTGGGTTTSILSDFTAPLPEPVAEYGGGLTRYTSGTPATGRLATGSATFLLNDAQASPIATLGSGGTVTATYDRDALGVPVGTADPLSFAGHAYDAATGLYEVGARAFDPTTGRFNQPSGNGHAFPDDAGTILPSRLTGAKGMTNVGGGGTAVLDKSGTGLRPLNLFGSAEGLSPSDKLPASWGGGSWFARWWMDDPNLALTSRITGTATVSDITSIFYNGGLANSCGTFPKYAVGNIP